MKSLRGVRRELAKEADVVFKELIPRADQEIVKAYHKAGEAADKEILDGYRKAGKPIPWEKLPVATPEIQRPIEIKLPGMEREKISIDVTPPGDKSFFQVDKERLETLIKDVHVDMNKARYAAIARSGSVYEEIVRRADAFYQSGTYTIDQAIEMAAQEAAEAGLNAVVYKDGKQINVASYVEMALRTSGRRATMTAEGARRDKYGTFLVVSPTLHSTCPICQKWQGKILIDDVFAHGEVDGKHALLSTAAEDGFLHPNCRHPLATYVEGITQIPTASPYDETRENYEAEQKQRYLERKIRYWKRKEAIAGTDESLKEAKAQLNTWQQKMREHLKANPQLRRQPQRERLLGIYKA